MSASRKVSPLRHLVNILSDTVAQIEEKYASANLEFPTFDEPIDEKDPAWILLSDSKVAPLSSVIVAAASQLIVSARHPMQALNDIAQSYTASASLRLACAAHVAEILREAGSGGLHVEKIVIKNKLHPGKLARALRLLAIHHVFVEVSPNVFANNTLSSVLDTGKSVDVLLTEPKEDKFKGITSSNPAWLEMIADDPMKLAAFVTDTVLDPATSHSEEQSNTACMRLFGAKTLFDHLQAPGNEYQSARFQAAMSGSSDLSTAAMPGGFPWESLPKGTKIVDVGGGVGSACRDIMKENPFLRFTVQDLPGVTYQATEYWNSHEPGAISDGRVTIQAHDFFSPQPVRDADIFLLRYILHTRMNEGAIEILKRLREAAVPGKTKIVVIDAVIQYACPVSREVSGADGIVFEGSDEKVKVPPGLLTNLGKAVAGNHFLDLVMMATVNGQERTVEDFIQVTKRSGWKILKIYSPGGWRISHVLAEAV